MLDALSIEEHAHLQVFEGWAPRPGINAKIAPVQFFS